jgi:hypothetical protein
LQPQANLVEGAEDIEAPLADRAYYSQQMAKAEPPSPQEKATSATSETNGCSHEAYVADEESDDPPHDNDPFESLKDPSRKLNKSSMARTSSLSFLALGPNTVSI